MEMYSLTPENMAQHANQVKNLLLEALCDEGYISNDRAAVLSKTWMVSVFKPSWISRFLKIGKSKEEYQYIISKVVSRRDDPSDEGEEYE